MNNTHSKWQTKKKATAKTETQKRKTVRLRQTKTRQKLHLKEEQKLSIMENCANGAYTSFDQYHIERQENVDGFKYFFENDQWVMIRPSGTEPVLRTYAEAPTLEEVRHILKVTEETICG